MKLLRIISDGMPTVVVPIHAPARVGIDIDTGRIELKEGDLCLSASSWRQEAGVAYRDQWPDIPFEAGQRITLEWADDATDEPTQPWTTGFDPGGRRCLLCCASEYTARHMVEADMFPSLCDECIRDFARLLPPEETPPPSGDATPGPVPADVAPVSDRQPRRDRLTRRVVDDEFELHQPLKSEVPAAGLAYMASLLAQALLDEPQTPVPDGVRRQHEALWPRRHRYWTSEVQGLTPSGHAAMEALCRRTCEMLSPCHARSVLAERCERVQIAASAVLELCQSSRLLSAHEARVARHRSSGA
jgi:hypothetical protein